MGVTGTQDKVTMETVDVDKRRPRKVIRKEQIQVKIYLQYLGSCTVTGSRSKPSRVPVKKEI